MQGHNLMVVCKRKLLIIVYVLEQLYTKNCLLGHEEKQSGHEQKKLGNADQQYKSAYTIVKVILFTLLRWQS